MKHKVFTLELASENVNEQGVLEIPDGYTYLSADFAQLYGHPYFLPYKKMKIPASVEVFEAGIFVTSDPLEVYGGDRNIFGQIDADENNPFFVSVDGVLFTKDMKKLVSYPAGKIAFDIENGSKASNSFTYTVPYGVEVIGEAAFYACEELETVILPPTVKIIERDAFSYNEFLSIELPDNLQEIGEHAFYYSDIKVLNIPDSVLQINTSLFCSNQIIIVPSNSKINIDSHYYEKADKTPIILCKGENKIFREFPNSTCNFYFFENVKISDEGEIKVVLGKL